MPVSLPVPTKNPGDVIQSSLWNSYVRDNVNKLLNTGHRVLTVAQFNALTGLEGTKGSVAPDEVYLEVDSTNGIQWHLAYESGETTYKWRFLGGPPMVSSISASESANFNGTWGDLTTIIGVTNPRAGDFYCLATANPVCGAGTDTLFTSVTAGVVAGSGPMATGATLTAGAQGSHTVQGVKPAVAASTSIRIRYSGGNQSNSWANRVLAVWPNRLV